MVRLQKFLADAGVASRRASEKVILAGQVRVNGKEVRELGTKVDPDHDRVEVDGMRLKS
ncbi:MAG: S4 domain-containing protein, partial [Verrucomicrobiota bacterium]